MKVKAASMIIETAVVGLQGLRRIVRPSDKWKRYEESGHMEKPGESRFSGCFTYGSKEHNKAEYDKQESS
jgi:hypothetical protein